MIPYTKFLILFGAAAALLAFGAGAQADDLAADPSALARAKARCAAFGSGFTTIEGSDVCVWRGSHIRIGFGSHGASSPAASGGAMHVNAGDESNQNADVAPSHLRLPDDDETGSIPR
jgi:hypothetical protein